MTTPDDDKPYREQRVAPPGDLAWHRDGGFLVATGTCPVCGHRTDKSLVDIVPGTVTKGLPWGRKKPQANRDRTVDCECRITHREADERNGCGACWTVRLPEEGAL
ncbi:hypothetical protein ACFY7C_35815 [Streptomyces sp. NPDC012769]|uniref:hypothetical protein n=1 Tax=Streptomyces sp. NPDC012769 TaxID=3364848 RepID=UPI00367964FE